MAMSDQSLMCRAIAGDRMGGGCIALPHHQLRSDRVGMNMRVRYAKVPSRSLFRLPSRQPRLFHLSHSHSLPKSAGPRSRCGER
jgi:hypothetical protein